MKKARREIHVARPHRDRKGVVGSTITVRVKNTERGQWRDEYRISTRGKTDAQIEAAVARISEQHEKREVRMNALALKASTVLRIGGAEYRYSVLTITQRGTDFELTVSVKDASGRRTAGMPLRWVKSSVDFLPSYEDIEEVVRSTIAANKNEESEHQARVLAIAAKLQSA